MSLNENPVFVVGVFRSGTSLLCSLLNQNPKIALMFECDVWNFPRPLLKARFRGNWAERIEFYNQALSRHQLVSEDDYSALETIRAPLDLYCAFGNMTGNSPRRASLENWNDTIVTGNGCSRTGSNPGLTPAP